MADADQVLGDPPEIALGARHPVRPGAIEAREVHRRGVGAQRAVAAQVDVAFEVAQDELTYGAVDRFAVAQAGEVGLGDRAPVATHLVDGQHVVGVLHRLQIEEQRREAEHAQGRRREHRALETVSGARPQDPARRPRRTGVMIGHGVERTLHPVGCAERPQGAKLSSREAGGGKCAHDALGDDSR